MEKKSNKIPTSNFKNRFQLSNNRRDLTGKVT